MTTLFLTLCDISLKTTYIFLCIIIIRFLLRKAPKRFSFYLWFIMFLRLLMPASIESSVSFIPQRVQENTILKHTVIKSNAPIVERVEKHDSVSTELPMVQSSSSKQLVEPYHWVDILAYLWVIVASLLLFRGFVAYMLLHKKLKGAEHRKDNIYLSENIQTPFVMGILHPRIYLPAAISKDEAIYVLYHEQYHIKRKDHISKILAYGITCIYWFLPFSWLAFYLMNKDMEMSCDEAVVNTYGTEIKKAYSTTLLHFAISATSFRANPLSFGEGNTKERIHNILSYKKRKTWLTCFLMICLLLIAVGLLTNPKSSQKDTGKAQNINMNLKKLSYTDEKYAEQIYAYKGKVDKVNELLGILDYGKDYAFNTIETSKFYAQDETKLDGGDSICILLNTSIDLSMENMEHIPYVQLQQNAYAILALDLHISHVSYKLQNHDKSFYFSYSSQNEQVKQMFDNVNTLEEFKKSLQTDITKNEKAAFEFNKEAIMSKEIVFHTLKKYMPAAFYENFNGYSEDYGSYNKNEYFYMFSNHSTSPYELFYDTQLSFNETGITHYVLKYYSFNQPKGYKPSAITMQEGQVLVDAFVKDFRKDASKFSFEPKAVPGNHVYSKDHIESWVASVDGKNSTIMVDLDHGLIAEADFYDRVD